MYVTMPLKVCPNCSYYRLEGALCISGLNVFSRKIAKEGDITRFAERARGALCPNNLYIAALAIPILTVIPALFINFSWALLFLRLTVIALMLYRFFIVLPKIACVHCRVKKICPNAISMGVDKT